MTTHIDDNESDTAAYEAEEARLLARGQRDVELFAIKAECLDGLLQQLTINGYSAHDLLSWAVARQTEEEAKEEGISVAEAFANNASNVSDFARDDQSYLFCEVADALKQMGHDDVDKDEIS